MGHIHAGRIKHSARHKRIVELLQEAGYPLSAQDIALRAYPNANPPKVMLNVSTNIGEMRSQENIDDGYIVSYSTKWKAAPGQPPARRANGDGSVTFYVPAEIYTWHDGRPRYYLIAAPGWVPRWIIDNAGNLRKHGGRDIEPVTAKAEPNLLHTSVQPCICPIAHNEPDPSPETTCTKCSGALPMNHRGAPFCPACKATLYGGLGL